MKLTTSTHASALAVLPAISDGIGLLLQPGLRSFVLLPLTINTLIFAALTVYLLQQLDLLQLWVDSIATQYLPTWLGGAVVQLATLVLALSIGLLLAVLMGYCFTTLANIIAAPFNSLLAARIEERLTGIAPPDEDIMAMLWRTLGREVRKLLYFIPRTLGILLLTLLMSVIPGVNLFAPLLAFAWASWGMAIQYLDYPMDNHQIPFDELRQLLWRQKMQSLIFGGIMLGGALLPVVNFLVMPVAVATASVIWCRTLRSLIKP